MTQTETTKETVSKGYKTVIATIHEERYFDCPYCGFMVSDHGSGSEISEGNFVECDNCGKKARIDGVE